MLAPGTISISKYLPGLSGSDFGAIQLQNTHFAYNELTTADYQAGLWLQTDILFAGPLQPISDVFKNVFHQEKPALTVQGLMSATNDWAKPLNPVLFGLRGLLQGISIKLADLIEFTELGLSINISRHSEMYPPYAEKVDMAYGFFGSLNLGTPKAIAPMAASISLSEFDGILHLFMTISEDTAESDGFCGIGGLQINSVMFSASFPIRAPHHKLPLPHLLPLSFEIHLWSSMGFT